MNVIIAGCRHWACDQAAGLVEEAVAASGWRRQILAVTSGGAAGVDHASEKWARGQGLPVHVYEAEWMRHGKAAGPIRDRKMAVFADALIAIWDGSSRGTRNMIEEMRALGKPVYVHLVEAKP